MTGHWLVLAAIAVRTVTVPAATEGTLRVSCTAQEVTRIEFAEPLRQIKASAEDRRRFGLKVERTQPRGVVTVRPDPAAGTARLEFRGPTQVLELVLETTHAVPTPGRVALGPPTVVAPPTPTPEPPTLVPPMATSIPTVAPLPSPTPTREVRAATPQPTALPTATPAPSELLWAKAVVIGRREGLPGQRAMVLVDALNGRDSIWLRFRLEDGAAARMARVSWEHGEVTTFEEVADGKDRRIVVQLPRSLVTPKTRVSLEVANGPTYRFPLSAPTLARLLRSLFQ